TARLERTGKVLIAVFGLLGLFLLQRHFVVEDARWVMGRVLLDPIVLVGVFLLSLLSGLLLVLIANAPLLVESLCRAVMLNRPALPLGLGPSLLRRLMQHTYLLGIALFLLILLLPVESGSI